MNRGLGSGSRAARFVWTTRRRSRRLAGVAAPLAALVVAVVAASSLMTATANGAGKFGPASATSTPSLAAAAVPTLSSSPTPTPVAAPTEGAREPVVPVVSFWSGQRDISAADVTGLWAGMPAAISRSHYTSVVAPSQDAAAIGAAFYARPGADVEFVSLAGVKAAVRDSPTTLGLLLAADVSPDIRALSVDGVSLFGAQRTKDVTRWPLTGEPAAVSPFSTATMWTLAAGGDVNLERGVYIKADELGYGADFPWSAGNAVITGYECCGFNDAALVTARDTGPSGALRDWLADADLALVNLEGSAPNDWMPRQNSLVFTFDPALLRGLTDAGIDLVSLANNHIRNGGDQGVLDTCKNLDAAGIAHAGAGANTTAARQPAWLRAGGLRVAVLAYSAVGGDNWATSTTPGAAPLHLDEVRADIQAARAQGAEIVIVMPHWGEEYSYALSAEQEDDAAAFVAAGADLVLGSHSHWVGAVESIARPSGPNGPGGQAFVDYSLGDLLFTLNHDVASQEGVIATMTFVGTRLVQVDLQPTIMIDQAQVGLLDPAGDGQAVLQAIHTASRGLLSW